MNTNAGQDLVSHSDKPKQNVTALLKLLSQGENDIREGRVKPQADVFNDLESQLDYVEKRRVDSRNEPR